MIGFTNSLTTTINDRAERLREAAAREALVRAARRASQARQRLEVAQRVSNEQPQALFSWQNRDDQRRREARRALGRRALGKAR